MAKRYRPFILTIITFLLAMLMHYLRTGFWYTSSVLVILLLYMGGVVLALFAWLSKPEKEKL